MRIALDANCVIYLVQQIPAWSLKVAARLTRGLSAGDQFAASYLTRAECLVGPFRSGDVKGVADFRSFFSAPSLRMLDLTADVCEEAARLRAVHNFKMPDALNLAAAILHGCDRFLTNDSRLARCTGIVVEVLT